MPRFQSLETRWPPSAVSCIEKGGTLLYNEAAAAATTAAVKEFLTATCVLPR
jgi:hypothetical protein